MLNSLLFNKVEVHDFGRDGNLKTYTKRTLNKPMVAAYSFLLLTCGGYLWVNNAHSKTLKQTLNPAKTIETTIESAIEPTIIQDKAEEKKPIQNLPAWQKPIAEKISKTEKAGLEKILNHYNTNLNVFHDIIAQECGYDISVIGPFGERGYQFMKPTADFIAKKVADPNDSLYYPGFSLDNYKFENLSKDYELNNILKAAFLKHIDNIIKKNNINKDELFNNLKKRGLNLEYEKFGKTAKKLKPKLISLWEKDAENYKETLVTYLYYNAGGKINDRAIYNMGLLMNNAQDYQTIRMNIK